MKRALADSRKLSCFSNLALTSLYLNVSGRGDAWFLSHRFYYLLIKTHFKQSLQKKRINLEEAAPI